MNICSIGNWIPKQHFNGVVWSKSIIEHFQAILNVSHNFGIYIFEMFGSSIDKIHIQKIHE